MQPLLDEEAQMNQAATVPAPAGQPAQGGQRQASPSEQAMLDLVVRQAAQFLTSEDAAVHLARAAKANGPEAASQEAVDQALTGVLQAAEAAGKQVPADVQAAARQALLALVATMLQAAAQPDEGEVDDGGVA